MTTQHEQRADREAEEWLQSLPPEIRAHTVSTQALKEHWITNSPKQLAVTFVDCVRQRAWDGIAYMPSVESKREVRHYTPLQWMRECIGAEPDELMRTVAGHLPNAEEASAAAITMIDLLKDEEPDTLRELCRDYRHGESNMLGWNSLFKMLQEADPVWAQAQAQLQEAVKGKRGRPSASNSAQRAELSDPTVASYGAPKDRKSRLIRTLTNLKDDPEACQAKGTTPEKVQEAVKGKPGNKGPRNEDGTFANAAHCAAKDPTVGSDRKPKDRKSRLIRTLTNLKDDPEALATCLAYLLQAAPVALQSRYREGGPVGCTRRA